MPNQGPAFYVQPYGPPGFLYLAERQITCLGALSVEPRDPFAGVADMLYGGRVFQTTPKLAQAPLDLSPESFSLEMTDKAEEEHHAVFRARQLSQVAPVSAWLPVPIEDRWFIPATAKTEWILSRNFAFSLVPFDANDTRLVPRVFIEETPGDTETRVELTRNATSPPDSGEFYVDTTTDGDTIETLDLSAFAGRVLVLRYHPKRLVRVGPIPTSIPEWNALDYRVTLDELIPVRDYVPDA